MAEPADAHWLDQVLAVPTVGVLLSPNPELSVTYPTRAAALIARLQKDGAVAVGAKSPYEVSVQTAAGYSFAFSSENLVFSFRYTSPMEDRAGTLPIRKAPEPRPFSALLNSVLDRASDAIRALLGSDSVNLLRVGLVAEAWIAVATPPPGIADLVAHLGRPWNQRLQKVNATLLAELERSGEVTERCHHRLAYDDGEEVKELVLGLDWQRLFRGGQVVKAKDLVGTIGQCATAALKYFQALGDGTALGGS